MAFFWLLSAKGLFDALHGKDVLFAPGLAIAWWSSMLAIFSLVSLLKLRDRLQ